MVWPVWRACTVARWTSPRTPCWPGWPGSVAHRGPDETVVRRDGPVGLAFTRLSLVDPEGGGQPLESADGSAVLIANGEVYNHRALAATLPPDVRLRTGSDCEVLVHLYRERGLRFFDDVHGMVSIVIWDKREQRLLLVRDRFAIKPLYWTRIGDRIAFGSEIKALLGVPGCPRALDWGRALSDQALTGQPVFERRAADELVRRHRAGAGGHHRGHRPAHRRGPGAPLLVARHRRRRRGRAQRRGVRPALRASCWPSRCRTA